VLGDLDCEGSCPDGPARVLLRPEQLRLSAPRDSAPTATVRGVDFYGHDSRVWLELTTGVTVSARLEGAEVPAAGDRVSISVRGPALSFPAGASVRRVAELPEGTVLAGTTAADD
jgi:iron(III) transport system ATP-binding protein